MEISTRKSQQTDIDRLPVRRCYCLYYCTYHVKADGFYARLEACTDQTMETRNQGNSDNRSRVVFAYDC